MGCRIRMVAILGVLAWLGGCGDGHVGGAPDGGAVDASVVDAPSCGGLDVAACRQTAGCATDFCSDCTCGQTYEGCRAEADAPFECPPLICPAPTCCGGDGACEPGDQCLHPGETPGCGVPNIDPGDCTSDGDCTTAGDICEPIPCSSVGGLHCVPGCTGAGDCPTGTECNPEHRCTSQPCDVATPCPTDFHCDEAFCARDACTLDVDCAGFCVDGLCYDAEGTCAPIPS